jgi:TRAP-type C4-dicarboxylate transport system permease small subunit
VSGPPNAQRWLPKAVAALDGLLATLAGCALFALMLLTFVDVMGRELYRSLPGALELSEMLMVVVLFCALPMVSLRAEHVCFELADAIYKGRAQRISKVVMDLICVIAFGAVGWACGGYARRTMQDGDVSAHLGVPIGLFVYLMAAMLMLAALMHLLRCFVAPPPPTATEAYE